MKYAGADWVKSNFHLADDQISDLGRDVANILGAVWYGIYHLDGSALKKVGWSNPDYMQITLPHTPQMATWDFNELTHLVVLAHDLCIRIAVGAKSARQLQLLFHRRQRDSAGMSTRHPTIEQAIEATRKLWNEKESSAEAAA